MAIEHTLRSSATNSGAFMHRLQPDEASATGILPISNPLLTLMGGAVRSRALEPIGDGFGERQLWVSQEWPQLPNVPKNPEKNPWLPGGFEPGSSWIVIDVLSPPDTRVGNTRSNE